MSTHTLRHAAHRLLHNPTGKHPVTAWINRALAALIIVNCAAVALETVPDIFRGNERAFFWLEAISTSIFAIEYLVRLWCSVEQADFSRPLLGRLRWMLRPVALFDLVVVVTYFAPVDLRFLRLVRLLRLLRVMSLDRMAGTYDNLKHSIAARKDLLMVSAVLMCCSLFASAALVYVCEHSAQPTIFTSIPATLWWSVVSLTTIGYGDMVPITAAGKICASISTLFGIGVFALPAAILTGAVIEADSRSKTCPHCGKGLH
ncbi:MAG: ion transporter [Betaproteobacteria bacterium]